MDDPDSSNPGADDFPWTLFSDLLGEAPTASEDNPYLAELSDELALLPVIWAMADTLDLEDGELREALVDALELATSSAQELYARVGQLARWVKGRAHAHPHIKSPDEALRWVRIRTVLELGELGADGSRPTKQRAAALLAGSIMVVMFNDHRVRQFAKRLRIVADDDEALRDIQELGDLVDDVTGGADLATPGQRYPQHPAHHQAPEGPAPSSGAEFSVCALGGGGQSTGNRRHDPLLHQEREEEAYRMHQ